MSQATDSPTTSRVHFSSAGAVRRSKLDRAHGDLIARLSNLRPPTIRGSADVADIETTAEHLHGVYGLFAAYVDSVVADTIDHLVTTADADLTRIDLILGDACNEGAVNLVAQLSKLGCRFGGLRAAA